MKTVATISGLVVAGILLAQGGATGPLSGHTKALADAQGLSATFTFQRIGGSTQSYRIDLAKPGMARIDKPNELIVSDGKTVVVLDKKANTYYKAPVGSGDLDKHFSQDELVLFAPFFTAGAFDKFAKVTASGTKNRKGVAMNVVTAQVDKKGYKTATYYLDPTTNLARQIEFTFTDGPEPIRMLVDTKEITLSDKVDASLFAFSAPADSTEISLDEVNNDKWYYDLAEAKAAAKKSGRKIFVDFFATWCGPCKKLAAEVFPTPEFKKLSKYFVFLQIDVDAQKDVSQQYGITAMPTQMVLAADGTVVGKTVGYGSPEGFFNFINGYTN